MLAPIREGAGRRRRAFFFHGPLQATIALCCRGGNTLAPRGITRQPPHRDGERGCLRVDQYAALRRRARRSPDRPTHARTQRSRALAPLRRLGQQTVSQWNCAALAVAISYFGNESSKIPITRAREQDVATSNISTRRIRLHIGSKAAVRDTHGPHRARSTTVTVRLDRASLARTHPAE